MTEVVTRKVKGQAGDSSFLNVYQRGITEMAKLEGLYEKREVIPTGDPQPQLHLHAAIGNFEVGTIPTEVLLEARGLMARLKQQILQ